MPGNPHPLPNFSSVPIQSPGACIRTFAENMERPLTIRRYAFILLGFLVLAPSSACAHGFARYISTPVSPPDGFQWVLVGYPVVAVTVCSIVLWRLCGSRFATALIYSVAVICLASVLFWMFGRFSATTTTAPPPGLGPPSTVFWGFGWSEVGFLFVQWNLIGIAFLTCCAFIGRRFAGAKIRECRRITLLLTFSVAYLIGTVPFAATGALSHGWAGGYVNRACERNLEAIYTAMESYATDHDGKLPTGDNFSEVLVALEPYMEEGRSYYRVPPSVCPIGGAYEKVPEPYHWDRSFSGTTFKATVIRIVDDDQHPVSCPYHEAYTLRNVTWKLIDKRFSYE